MKYTREQIMDAISNNSPAGVTFEEAEKIANALGLEVEDPKPKPGLYLFDSRFPVMIDADGNWWNLYLTGDPSMRYEDTPGDPHDLTPARVLPAEPVVLTEEQVGELWDATEGTEIHWHLVSDPARRRFMVCLNAALAKYGHGVA